jgi:hypothetical protein
MIANHKLFLVVWLWHISKVSENNLFFLSLYTFNTKLKKRKSVYISIYMRVICKVCGLALLLWVETLWRCSGSLFFKVPPLASDALLTTLHPLLENVPQTTNHFKSSCLGAPFSWLEKPRNCSGQDLDCMADFLMGFQWSTFSKLNTEFSSYLAPCDFWAFPTMKMELWGRNFQSDQWSAACFWEVDRVL